MRNADTVREIYGAFARGDIEAMLGHVAADCEWESWENNTAQTAGVPYLLPRKGPPGCAEFFEVVGRYEIRDFEVLDVIGDGRQVVVEVFIHNVTPAGRELRDEELHLWTFDEAGKVTRLRHYVDTAKHAAAHQDETE